MERRGQVVGCGRAVRVGAAAEEFQGFGLGGGGEGDVADAGVLGGAAGHVGGEQVFDADLAAVVEFGGLGGGQDGFQLCCGLSGLGGMGLVGDHGEALASAGRQFAHGFQGEGEGLDGADHDLFARRQRVGEFAAFAGALAGDDGDHAARAFELFQRLAQLHIQHAAVGDDQHGVEQLGTGGVVQVGEEMGGPGDGVGFA